MISAGKLFILLSFFNISLLIAAQEPAQTAQKRDYRVRVLLHEAERPMTTTWKVQAEADICLIDPDTKIKRKLKANILTIGFKDKKFIINNEPIDSKKFYLASGQGNLSLENKEYHGSLLFTWDADSVYAINSIDIEDYVCSVLRTESWPGWPLEVNKVFAIASRSYVIGVILKNKPTTPYHVKNTNKHQTYSGVHDDPVLKKAVEETKGMFLVDAQNNPIVAMFDSCCGGIVPARIYGVDFTHSPYLAREYACTFCKDCRVYNWSVEYPVNHIEQILKKEIKTLKNMQQVKVTKLDKAGLVQQITVKSKHKTHVISGKKLYSLFPKIRSFHFDVKIKMSSAN